MAKGKRGQARNPSLVLEQTQIHPHRNAAESQNRADPVEFEFAFQVRPAIRQFRRQRFVRGRRTSQSGCNIGILQQEPVPAVRRSWLIREPGAEQRLIQKISRTIAGEHTPGAIAAMRRGSKTQNQELRARISEAGNRFAPIIPFAKRAPLRLRDLFPVAHQARTLAAVNYFLI